MFQLLLPLGKLSVHHGLPLSDHLARNLFLRQSLLSEDGVLRVLSSLKLNVAVLCELADLTVNLLYLRLNLEHGVRRPSLLLDRYGVAVPIVAPFDRLAVLVRLHELLDVFFVGFELRLMEAVEAELPDVQPVLEVADLAFDGALALLNVGLQRDHGLVDFRVVELQLVLQLGAPLKVSRGAHNVRLSVLTQHLQLVQEAALTLQQLPLLVELHAQRVNLVFASRVLDLNGLLDGSLVIFLAAQHLFLLIDDVAHGCGLRVQLLLAHLHEVQRLHELLHARLAAGLEVADDALGGPDSVTQPIRLLRNALDVRYEIVGIAVEPLLDP